MNDFDGIKDIRILGYYIYLNRYNFTFFFLEKAILDNYIYLNRYNFTLLLHFISSEIDILF